MEGGLISITFVASEDDKVKEKQAGKLAGACVCVCVCVCMCVRVHAPTCTYMCVRLHLGGSRGKLTPPPCETSMVYGYGLRTRKNGLAPPPPVLILAFFAPLPPPWETF